MVTNYQINNQYAGFKDLEDYLELIAEIVLKPSRYLLNKLNSLHSNNEEKYQKNHEILINEYVELKNKFDNDKINLYQDLDLLAISLKENELFYDEYFDFCEIKDMIKDTFDRDLSSINNDDFEFILELVTDFSEIISYKYRLIENNDFDETIFESKYNEYLTNFNKSKSYYYENICDESIDDELFKEYSRIIME